MNAPQVVFSNLLGEMRGQGIRPSELAALLGISEKVLLKRLHGGKPSFSIAQLRIIKLCFPDNSLQYLLQPFQAERRDANAPE